MFFISEWYVLPAAFLLDLLLGDPVTLPHPVRWMGKSIEIAEPWFRKKIGSPRVAGLFFVLFLLVLTWLISTGVLFAAASIGSVAGVIMEIILIYYCLSTLSLKKAAIDVARSLRDEGVIVARKRLAFIVGRDVNSLDQEGVSRAALETVAENLVDGIISPLIWAGLLGAPFAVVYKMINTLDSMVGYKNEKYHEFGMVAARIDDAANYFPARLSLVMITLAAKILSLDWKGAFRTAVTDGRNHSSPNAGLPEAAFSGALRVKLGGPNYYGGHLVDKPYIGKANCGNIK